MDLEELKRLLEKVKRVKRDSKDWGALVIAQRELGTALETSAPKLIEELERLRQELRAVRAGQDALKAQTTRIRKAALGGQSDQGGDTEEIVRTLRTRFDAAIDKASKEPI